MCLKIHWTPTVRRDNFNNWIIKVDHVLATHKATREILQHYPTIENIHDDDTNRAVNALVAAKLDAKGNEHVRAHMGNGVDTIKALYAHCASVTPLDI